MARKKIITVLGARPQFIKASVVSEEIKKNKELEENIIHTGQHFDKNMSDVFFKELSLDVPKYNLAISGLTHGALTGRMLEGIENILIKEKPSLVLVYGDTDSTLAGCLAASKLDIPVAHVESGLRSRNLLMPEEKNRIITDALSQLLFCPSNTAVQNLKKENITKGVTQVGDVMLDVMNLRKRNIQDEMFIKELELDKKAYILCTLHRKENTNDLKRLKSIFSALSSISKQIKVILPIHPRTKKILEENKIRIGPDMIIVEPLAYEDFLKLQLNSMCILTDSGGLQKEAFFNSIPCITLRYETEWIETVESGWNIIAGAESASIKEAWFNLDKQSRKEDYHPYGQGDASKKIVNSIKTYLL